MRSLDRAGIFKARPVAWTVKVFDQSGGQAVAISITFAIVAQLDGGEWIDSAEQEHRVFGDYFVVKRDGSPNVGTVQQLSASLGWQGSLKLVQATPNQPPACVVQITVKEEAYNGKTFFKAGWMNPEDYVPTQGGADDATVEQLESRFGSGLRAAATGKPAAEKPARKAKAPPPVSADDIPFALLLSLLLACHAAF